MWSVITMLMADITLLGAAFETLADAEKAAGYSGRVYLAAAEAH